MTSLLDLLRDPLFRSTVLTLWLLPCAIQDRRTRHVSNWLTVPLFAVFIGVYVATKLELRAGAADGKLMVGLAAFAPLALGIGALLEAVVFIFLRMCGRSDAAIPGALWLYIGSVLSAVAQVILA